MKNELVNAVQCAKIITNEYGRKVDRSYITRLANNDRIPYEVFEDNKLFNPKDVLDSLPAERFVASKFDDEVTQLKIIEEAISNGVKVKFNKQRPKKLFADPGKLCEDLPLIEDLTIEDIRKSLKKKDYEKEELELITDDIIQRQIDQNKVDFKTLNDFWKHSSDGESVYFMEFNNKSSCFTDDQSLKLFCMIMWQFPRADFIAEWCYDEATI